MTGVITMISNQRRRESTRRTRQRLWCSVFLAELLDGVEKGDVSSLGRISSLVGESKLKRYFLLNQLGYSVKAPCQLSALPLRSPFTMLPFETVFVTSGVSVLPAAITHPVIVAVYKERRTSLW